MTGRPPLPVGTYGAISVREEAPGKHRARCRFRDFDGQVRYVVRFGPSKSAAERNLKEALVARVEDGHGIGMNGSTTVATLAEEWLRDVDADPSLARSTKARYREVAEGFIVPGVGALRLREIGVAHVDRLLRTLTEKHGASNAKTARSVLSGMIGQAMRQGAMNTNPVRDAKPIRVEKKAPRALTIEEAKKLLGKLQADPDAIRLDLPDLCAFMLGTGVRIGEACAVQLDQLDLEAGTIEVSRTDTRFGIEERTKTKAGWRVIAVPAGVVSMLQRRIADPEIRTDAVLFPSPAGRVRDSSNTTGDLRRAFDRAGFDWVTSHTFRKTVATRLDEAGLSARQIADHLGHAQPSMTLDVYMGRRVAVADAANALDLG